MPSLVKLKGFKMRKTLNIASAVLLLTFVSAVNAENVWRIGATYSFQEVDINGRDFDAAGLTAGYLYNQYVGLEVRFLAGTSGYSGFYGMPDAPWGNYSEDINTQASLLLKAQYPIFKAIKLYGLAGYSNTEIEINGLAQQNDAEGNITGNVPYKQTITEGGFTYGVGLDYQISERFDVFVDYQVLPDFRSRDWDSITIGVSYSF
ncbi:porin family protein [Alteromonas lipolytica]|nr:porin family protein [Alteromonas lipolytica]